MVFRGCGATLEVFLEFLRVWKPGIVVFRGGWGAELRSGGSEVGYSSSFRGFSSVFLDIYGGWRGEGGVPKVSGQGGSHGSGNG